MTTYTCEVCNGIFETGWSEEEAEAERMRNGWADVPCGLVCDDCFKEMVEAGLPVAGEQT